MTIATSKPLKEVSNANLFRANVSMLRITLFGHYLCNVALLSKSIVILT